MTVRCQAWNDARRAVGSSRAPRPRPRERQICLGPVRVRQLKNARYALWSNPKILTEHQTRPTGLDHQTDPRLHRAYLLKEGMRHVFAVKGTEGNDALDAGIRWARRSRLPYLRPAPRKIVKHR